MNTIKQNRLDRVFSRYQKEFEEKALEVLRSGWYVLGNEVKSFEQEFADYIGARFCVGLNSGLDALTLAIRSLGIGMGDEVIVPGNTYIATILGITENRAIPIFVEPDLFYNIDVEKIEEKITYRTKAILAVHLYGQACNMSAVMDIANKYNLYVIEDCAQAHGATWNGQKVGSFGIIGCFSFFPTKNLGAFGDGGAIVTGSELVAEKIRRLRNYGSKLKYYHEIEGVNSRLDELQAALLSVKLRHLNELLKERINISHKYSAEITNYKVICPEIRKGATHVFHLYVVRVKERERFQSYLREHGIDTQIHYPIPPHISKCYEKYNWSCVKLPITEMYADEVVSLPLYNGMTEYEINEVIRVVNSFE